MTEHAHELSPTSPPQQFDPTIQAPPPAPPPEPQRCSLCSTPLPTQAERCPACGLWMGGHGQAVARPTLYRVAAVFAGLYLAALLIVALAR